MLSNTWILQLRHIVCPRSMPAECTMTHHRDQWSNNPNYNTLINDTIEHIRTDHCKSYDEIFCKVWSLREQLWATHEALGQSLGQLSAANAHCTSIHWELGSVHQELENATKKKQPRSSKKIKA